MSAKITGWRPTSSEPYVAIKMSGLRMSLEPVVKQGYGASYEMVYSSERSVSVIYLTTIEYLEKSLQALRDWKVDPQIVVCDDSGGKKNVILSGVWRPQQASCSFEELDYVNIKVDYVVTDTPAFRAANLPSDVTITYPSTSTARLSYKTTTLQEWSAQIGIISEFSGLELSAHQLGGVAQLIMSLNRCVVQSWFASAAMVSSAEQSHISLVTVETLDHAPKSDALERIAARYGVDPSACVIRAVERAATLNVDGNMLQSQKSVIDYAAVDIAKIADQNPNPIRQLPPNERPEPIFNPRISDPYTPRYVASSNYSVVATPRVVMYNVLVPRRSTTYYVTTNNVRITLTTDDTTAYVRLMWGEVMLQEWRCPK